VFCLQVTSVSGGGDAPQDAEEVMEESANADKGGRRSLQQGGLSFGGSLTRRTDELSSAEWGALLLPSRDARRLVHPFGFFFGECS
jgi:hypothetical protein